MSSIPGSHIYLGPWVNWDRGLIVGSTLTLSARDGGFLNSFLATFVTIVGAQLWRILCYIFHQARSSPGAQDGLHHQHQNILRNSSSPGGAAWSYMRMSAAWRNRTRRPILRSLPWALLAILYMCVFGVLSIFQSETAKSTGKDRLVIGNNCGYWRVNAGLTPQEDYALKQKVTNDSILAANYARSCYGGSPNVLQCSLYPTVAISWKEDRNAACPFKDEICSTNAFKLDTGLVDSHSDLGINAPTHERVQYRKVTTCAPLEVLDYTTLVVGNYDNGALPEDYLYEINYGYLLNLDGSTSLNYTFIYNDHARIDDFGYSVSTANAFAQPPVTGGWSPIPALNRTDADVTLVSVSANSMLYLAPVDDPIFSAHKEVNYKANGQAYTIYASDHYVRVLGCADQHQFCNPNNGICTPLSGATQLENKALDPTIDLNFVQRGAMDRIFSIAQYTSIYQAVMPRKDASLRAQESATDLQSAGLPADQWRVEVSNWFGAGLARLQRGVVEYATGPTNIVPGLSVFIPDDLVSKAMCYSQKIADPQDTISFSLLGVAIILIVGALIIATSLVIDVVVGWVQQKLKKGEHARLNWILDDKMQLQRLAFEGAGMGLWEGHTAAVPTTTGDERFLAWDEVDSLRPTLKADGSGDTLRVSGKDEEQEEKRASIRVHEIGSVA